MGIRAEFIIKFLRFFGLLKYLLKVYKVYQESEEEKMMLKCFQNFEMRKVSGMGKGRKRVLSTRQFPVTHTCENREEIGCVLYTS